MNKLTHIRNWLMGFSMDSGLNDSLRASVRDQVKTLDSIIDKHSVYFDEDELATFIEQGLDELKKGSHYSETVMIFNDGEHAILLTTCTNDVLEDDYDIDPSDNKRLIAND